VKLSILTQYYPPEIGAPQARLSELAAHFVGCGHEVTVLTAMPNYPTGRLYTGYDGWLRRECLDGVDVIRTLIYPTKQTDFAHRLCNYFSFVVSSTAIGSACLPRPDYLLVESPPLFLGLSGIWLSWLKLSRLIFNVSDLWPESAVRLNLINAGGFSHRLGSLLEAFCYKQAWLISGQSKSILENISERFPEQRVFHLSNGVDTRKFGPACETSTVRTRLAHDNQCVALYAGLHGLAQGLDQLLNAAAMLQEDKDLCFVMVGDGPEKEKLIAQATSARLTNVRFLDSVPASEMPALLAAGDIALVILKTDLPGAVPSKLYEAMASARPVILVAEGEAAQIVRKHEVGITVSPGDTAGLIRALQILRSNPDLRRTMGMNGRRAVETLFDRTKIATGFREYLEANLYNWPRSKPRRHREVRNTLAHGRSR
jgi:glycosyltransferase involved in cell wall biosynthesis